MSLPQTELLITTDPLKIRLDDCPTGLFIHVINTDSSTRTYTLSLSYDGGATDANYVQAGSLTANASIDHEIKMEIPGGALLTLTATTANTIRVHVGKRVA